MADRESREFTAEEGQKHYDALESISKTRGSRFSNLTVKVNVDCNEALTGLKALQREARKATQALRELEEAQNAVSASE